MALVGEKKERQSTIKKKNKLKDPTTYWHYLEAEGGKCLRDI